MSGFFTRPDLDDRQFKQLSGSTLTMSGETNFVGTLKSKGIEIDGSTGSSSIGDVLTWDGSKITLLPNTGGGSNVYSGATPSNITVGGIPAGTTLTGRTFSDILEQLLITTLHSAVVGPSHTMIDNQTSPQEIGNIISNQLTVNSFSYGSICPQYNAAGTCIAACAPRSGAPNTYNFYQPSGALLCSIGTNVATHTGYTVAGGANTWCTTVSYDASTITVYDSAGGVDYTPLGAGTTSQKTTSITGYYCRFYGATATTPANSADVRALPTEEFQTANAQTFCLNTGAVETKFVVDLPPGRTISCVIDLDALSTDITSEYDGTGIGAVSPTTRCVCTGGGTGACVTYCQYEMNIGAPYSGNHRHQITTA